MGGDTAAVDGSLAYSRGQLAVVPCVGCAGYYERDEWAHPFPECVILPERWGFACANCIVRGRSEECSFYVRSIKDQKKWEMKLVNVDHMRDPDRDTFHRDWYHHGHPLSKITEKGMLWLAQETRASCKLRKQLCSRYSLLSTVF